MPNLKGFRQYSEHDVVNLFSYSGDSTLVYKGTAVKVVGGLDLGSDTGGIEALGSIGNSYSNTVSQRFGVAAKVAPAGGSDAVLGLTLMDVRELDENGEKLVFNPRKAAEMGVVVSGQAVPVLTRGVVTYVGLTGNAGASVYLGSAGALNTTSTSNTKVGKLLSSAAAVTDAVLLKIEL